MSTFTLDPHHVSIDIFDNFRADLDDYNDRRERLIKASRDITNLSKKTIFLLHRIAQGSHDPNEDSHVLAKKAAQEGYAKLREIQTLYSHLRPELGGDKFWRYQRQVSPGLQEYIEALSFAHYLDHGTLITFDEVQHTLMDAQGVFFPLTISDYVLGLSDLTGELMRFAISGIARRGGRKKAQDVCTFVRGCKADFERMTPYIRELKKKQSVTSQSLEKIEDAAYTIMVRTSEYDLSPEMLDDIVTQSISSYIGTGRQPSRRGRGDRMSDDEDEDI
ncbi:Translin [Pholiota conissans]|uniref:Translin n=1 Tax=Pholiota conissans TaxID=109636 RepID=A0A9P5YPU1_9AGAR|nr:Translin [Pholiota conissans]